ncbi:MAG: hypothetical protein IPM03_08310 [Sulfuritalea sp.]|nr:hypothetical protein [Sulfuritalea sp.]
MSIDDCFLAIAIAKGKAAATGVRPFYLAGLYSLACDKWSPEFFKSLAEGLEVEPLSDLEMAWINYHPAAIRRDRTALDAIFTEVDAAGRFDDAIASVGVVTSCLRAQDSFMDSLFAQRDSGGLLVRH